MKFCFFIYTSPLISAIITGNIEILQMLLTNPNIDVNIKSII